MAARTLSGASPPPPRLQVAAGDAPTPIDIYGPTSGDDFEQVDAAAREAQLAITFRGPSDHADAALHPYKVPPPTTSTNASPGP